MKAINITIKNVKFNFIKPHKKNGMLMLFTQPKTNLNILIKNPKCLASKDIKETSFLNFIEYNNTTFKDIEKLNNVLKIQNKDDNSLNSKKSINTFIEYLNLIRPINKAREDNKSIFTLSVATLNLKDMFSEEFIKANDDIIDFDVFRRGEEANRDLTEADVVRVTYRTAGRDAATFENQNLKLENLGRLKESTEFDKVEYNIKKISNLINNGNDKRKLLSYQNFNIFKSIKKEYTSNIKITNKVINDEKFFKYYNIELDVNVLKDVYSKTNIKNISIINNKTENPKIQILVLRHTSSENFVEYKDDTASFIEISKPDIRILSIFDRNYNDYNQVKNSWLNGFPLVSEGPTNSSSFTGSGNNQNESNESSVEYLGDHIMVYKYTMDVESLINNVKVKSKQFMTGEAERKLYVHEKIKKLGINYVEKARTIRILDENSFKYSKAKENLDKKK